MRRFHSYGSIDTEEHYYAPRKELIEIAYTQLIGYNPKKSGHYFTVWAPRQTGKTWIMQEILFRLKKDPRFHVLKINLEHLEEVEKVSRVIMSIAKTIGEGFGKDFTNIDTREKFQGIFRKELLETPLILILDEFDALEEKSINAIVSVFRNIYFHRMDEGDKPTGEKTYLLHGVALIGVRSVLGIENQEGSPFNVQRSIHIPNLTFAEMEEMFKWYEKESELFQTREKTAFNFDDKELNYLYMNGVIDEEKAGHKLYYVRFSCPFVQKRIFNYFSSQIFKHLGLLIHPLDAINEETLHIPNIIKRYQAYLKKNKEIFFKNVPRRKDDMRIYEAIYHFNLFRYLYDLLRARGVEVIPQFPTGNGKVDLILKYREKIYALELKSFKDMYRYEKAIDQAGEYGVQMGLKEITLLVFVELSQEEAKQLEKQVEKPGIKVMVLAIGIL